MRNRVWTLFCVAVLFLASFHTALAVPPVPLNLYGTVQVNGANVAPNTLIVARCDGEVFGQTSEITLYNGETWYSNLDVTGDDPETTQKDGCYPGETVTFEIAGVVADQTTPWTGNSYQLDLTATSALLCHFADVHPNADHSNPVLCDNDVDIADVESVAGCWLQPATGNCMGAIDVDGNGTIDLFDLTAIANEWGWPDF